MEATVVVVVVVVVVVELLLLLLLPLLLKDLYSALGRIKHEAERCDAIQFAVLLCNKLL